MKTEKDFEELKTILLKEAEAEERRVLSEARDKAEKVVDEARKEAERIRKARYLLEAKRVEKEHKLKRSRERLKSQRAITEMEHEILKDVLSLIETRLKNRAFDYPQALEKWLSEALDAYKELGQKSGLIHCRSDDKDLVAKIVKGAGNSSQFQIQEDPNISGGIILTSPDNEFLIDNTVEARFKRALPGLSLELKRRLYSYGSSE